MSVFVSLSAHESEYAIIDQCLNYIQVGGVDGVVIHASTAAPLKTKLLTVLVNLIDELRGRVFVNPYRQFLRPIGDGGAITSVLHRAHVSNFLFLEGLGIDVQYFCLDASNTLIVRPGLAEHISKGNAVQQVPMVETWHWRPMILSDLGLSNCDVLASQHEGCVFTKSVFKQIIQFILEYETRAINAYGDDESTPNYPREEVIFATAFKALQLDEKPSEPYVWMRWERGLSWFPEEVNTLLHHGGLPDAKYAIKRIPRDINDPLRMMVGAYFGYRQILNRGDHMLRQAIEQTALAKPLEEGIA